MASGAAYTEFHSAKCRLSDLTATWWNARNLHYSSPDNGRAAAIDDLTMNLSDEILTPVEQAALVSDMLDLMSYFRQVLLRLATWREAQRYEDIHDLFGLIENLERTAIKVDPFYEEAKAHWISVLPSVSDPERPSVALDRLAEEVQRLAPGEEKRRLARQFYEAAKVELRNVKKFCLHPRVVMDLEREGELVRQQFEYEDYSWFDEYFSRSEDGQDSDDGLRLDRGSRPRHNSYSSVEDNSDSEDDDYDTDRPPLATPSVFLQGRSDYHSNRNHLSRHRQPEDYDYHAI